MPRAARKRAKTSRAKAKPAFRLAACDPMTFVATARPAAARKFYQDVLGLKFVADEYYAVVFDLRGIMLRIQKVEQHTPLQGTTLGWEVADIAAAVRELTRRGAKFERYEGMGQNELGIWRSPSGAQVAWFKDPDGNTLSLTEFA